MLYHQSVRVTNIFCSQRVHAEYLRAVGMRDDEYTLRDLILGPPLTERDDASETIAEILNGELVFVQALLRKIYGDTDAAKHAVLELGSVILLPKTRNGIHCRRAALVFAMREPEMLERFAEREQAASRDIGFAADVHNRILPLYAPRFLRNSAQAPDSFLAGVAVFSELWPGEKIGNWPLNTDAVALATADEVACVEGA